MATKKKPVKKKSAPKSKSTAKKKSASKKATAKKKPATKKATAKKKPATKKATAKKKPATKKATAKKKPATKKATAKKKPATKKAMAKKKPASKMAAPKKPEPKINPPKKPVLTAPKNKTAYTQSELFDCLTGYCGFSSKKDAKEFYAQFSDMIQGALKSGYRVVLPGLGKIQVRNTKARMGINPQTREPISIPARKKVRFTPNKALKDAVL